MSTLAPSPDRAAAPPPAATIRVYNTLSRTKEAFTPIQPGRVGIYLCGPTVYKPSHIGHMVGPVIFDAIKRYLAYSGYEVTWVVNITDVDDKLIVESQKRGMTMAALAEEMTADYFRNLQAVGVDTIDHFPRATQHIDGIIRLTQQLIERGYAYASDGDVYFDVLRDAEYGKLSQRTVESLQGEGGSTAERKHSPADFALWKSAKPGEPSWDSPWGPGRPGWHIECSAMSRQLLGESFDIHGGGLDLMFPHHENEIAQSECAHGQPQARYWLHNGLMQASGEVGKVGGRNTRTATEGDLESQQSNKISKSTGARPFRELLQQYAGETVRYFLLSTHYRRPIDFSDERLHEIERSMEAFYRFFQRFERITQQSFYKLPAAGHRAAGEFAPGDSALLQEVHSLRARFLEAMDDDFNTAGGMGLLFDLLRALNKHVDAHKLEERAAEAPTAVAELQRGTLVLRELTSVLGLFRTPVAAPAAVSDGLVDGLMQLILQLRADARKNKNFAVADQIRKALTELKVVLEDRPTGTEWRRE